MEERRKSQRLELQSHIVLKRLDGKEGSNAEVSVMDVSKTGVGFTCKEALTIGAVYESYLTIWTKEVLHAFLEIVRIEKRDDIEGFSYGAIFVGMPELEAQRIEVYNTVEQMKNSNK